MAEPARLRDRWVDREVPDAVIIVPLCDRSAIEALGLPVGVVACDGGAFLWRGAPLAPDLVHGAAICALVLTAEGDGLVGELAASWADTFGTDLPETIDLSGVASERRRETALARLCEIVFSDRGEAARRMVSVLRALAVLRQEHEAMQAAFARLEAHAALHRLSQRKLSFAMARVDGSPALVLPSGAGVVQRVPGGSVGLSDLAVRIAELPSRKGVLRCRLVSPDWGGTVAQWTVPAERIAAGWLRLSLVAGLDADPVGLELRLDWEGASPLRLETALGC